MTCEIAQYNFQLAAALFEDDDDDDNENSFSIRKIKKETGFAGENGFSREIDDDLDGGRMSVTSTVMSEVSKREPGAGSGPASRAPSPVYEPKIQPPFQPGKINIYFDL